MVKKCNSKDKNRHRLAVEELEEFNRLIKGHEKLLRAIGEL